MTDRPSRLRTKLGMHVMAARKQRNWTQDELAESATVSKRSVVSVEGGAKVSPKTLTLIEKALGRPDGEFEDILAGGEPTGARPALSVVTGGRPDEKALAAMLRAVYETQGFLAFRDEYARMDDRFSADLMAAIRAAFAELGEGEAKGIQ